MARQGWTNLFSGPDGKGLLVVKLPMGISDAKAREITENEQDRQRDQVAAVAMIGEPDQEPGLIGTPAIVRWVKTNRQVIKEKTGWKAITLD
jgi:hypothetical protein